MTLRPVPFRAEYGPGDRCAGCGHQIAGHMPGGCCEEMSPGWNCPCELEWVEGQPPVVHLREWVAQQIAEAEATNGTPSSLYRAYYWATRVEVLEELQKKLEELQP